MNYALAWTRRVEQYKPRWIEEPFQTANLDAFIELSRETSIPVATGEHFYGRWDVHKFLKNDAIMVVQADPEWCGGVSELVKMCTLASVHGVNVIPHGHSIHAAMHVDEQLLRFRGAPAEAGRRDAGVAGPARFRNRTGRVQNRGYTPDIMAAELIW